MWIMVLCQLVYAAVRAAFWALPQLNTGAGDGLGPQTEPTPSSSSTNGSNATVPQDEYEYAATPDAVQLWNKSSLLSLLVELIPLISLAASHIREPV